MFGGGLGMGDAGSYFRDLEGVRKGRRDIRDIQASRVRSSRCYQGFLRTSKVESSTASVIEVHRRRMITEDCEVLGLVIVDAPGAASPYTKCYCVIHTTHPNISHIPASEWFLTLTLDYLTVGERGR
jgi:hypothetical protein